MEKVEEEEMEEDMEEEDDDDDGRNGRSGIEGIARTTTKENRMWGGGMEETGRQEAEDRKRTVL